MALVSYQSDQREDDGGNAEKQETKPQGSANEVVGSIARLTWSSSRSAASFEDNGPIAVCDEVGSPGVTCEIAAENFSRNGS